MRECFAGVSSDISKIPKKGETGSMPHMISQQHVQTLLLDLRKRNPLLFPRHDVPPQGGVARESFRAECFETATAALDVVGDVDMNRALHKGFGRFVSGGKGAFVGADAELDEESLTVQELPTGRAQRLLDCFRVTQ